MIDIFKSDESGLVILEHIRDGCWINAVDPPPAEIDQMAELGLPYDFITYPLDRDERARIEWEDNGDTLVVIRIPYFQGTDADVPYITIPLGIVITQRFVMTVCSQQSDIINGFTSSRDLSTTKRNRFLLRILLCTAQKYLAHLREINKTVDTLEDKLQLSMKNKDLLELLKYQKSLVYFATALKANQLMLERLQRGHRFQMYPDDEDLLEDVITEIQQAIEVTNISSNILISTMEAFASIISNNLNAVMKFLASVTIVLSLPMLVTSYFGMNVNLPLQSNQFAFMFILGICFAISVVVILLFVRRDWF
jgi:magnesium transporter